MILKQRKRLVKVKSDEKITVRTFTEPLIYLLPFILVVSVFMVFPIITVFLNAFLENYDYLANTYTRNWGWGIFAALFSDKEFYLSLKNYIPLRSILSISFCISIFTDVCCLYKDNVYLLKQLRKLHFKRLLNN